MKLLAAKLAVIGGAAALLVGATAGTAAASFSLKGAGSTLAAPVIQNVWIPNFQSANSGDSVSYNAVGSGGGITDITGKLVDFGASDAPLTSAQQSACSACVQIPWILSATGAVTNLPGSPTLNLSGKVLAEIYLGQITNWDDPAIKALQPKGSPALPNLAITPVWRTDGSGDSFVFTSFLSVSDPAFASAIGAVQQPAFKVGTGAKGSSGVTAAIAGTSGAVGYISTYYAYAGGLKSAQIENASGKFVHPYPASLTDAADLVPSSALVANQEPVIANYVAKSKYTAPKVKKGHKAPKLSKKQAALRADELGAYPMATFSDVIVRPDSADIPDLQTFIKFCLSAAEQSKGSADAVAPLPAPVVAFDLKQVNAL
jgi:phosphate transport system substrate-binding protein